MNPTDDPAPRDEFGRYVAAVWTDADLAAFERFWIGLPAE